MREMRIGNQTSFCAKAMTPFEYAIAQKFDAFEWFPDKKENNGWQEQDFDASMRQYIKKTAHAHDITLSVHAPLHAEICRKQGAIRLEQSLVFARDIGAKLVNIHYEQHKQFAQALLPIIKKTAQISMFLSIENTEQSSPEQFNALFDWIRSKDIESNHLGICFDMGHANLHETSRNDYIGYFDRLNKNIPIIHVHAHENYGDKDSHLPIFTGPCAKDDSGIKLLLHKLQKRNFCGSIVMEQWPNPPEILKQTREKLLQCLSP